MDVACAIRFFPYLLLFYYLCIYVFCILCSTLLRRVSFYETPVTVLQTEFSMACMESSNVALILVKCNGHQGFKNVNTLI